MAKSNQHTHTRKDVFFNVSCQLKLNIGIKRLLDHRVWLDYKAPVITTGSWVEGLRFKPAALQWPSWPCCKQISNSDTKLHKTLQSQDFPSWYDSAKIWRYPKTMSSWLLAGLVLDRVNTHKEPTPTDSYFTANQEMDSRFLFNKLQSTASRILRYFKGNWRAILSAEFCCAKAWTNNGSLDNPTSLCFHLCSTPIWYHLMLEFLESKKSWNPSNLLNLLYWIYLQYK